MGERMMELASAAGGGCDDGAVGVSDCGGFAWILGSVGGTGTSAAAAAAAAGCGSEGGTVRVGSTSAGGGGCSSEDIAQMVS